VLDELALEGVWLDQTALTNGTMPTTTPPVPLHRSRALQHATQISHSSTPYQRIASNASTPFQQPPPLFPSSARSTPNQPLNALARHVASTTKTDQQGNVVEKKVFEADDCPVCQLLMPQQQNGQHSHSTAAGVCFVACFVAIAMCAVD
jgi:hypothetical protein